MIGFPASLGDGVGARVPHDCACGEEEEDDAQSEGVAEEEFAEVLFTEDFCGEVAREGEFVFGLEGVRGDARDIGNGKGAGEPGQVRVAEGKGELDAAFEVVQAQVEFFAGAEFVVGASVPALKDETVLPKKCAAEVIGVTGEWFIGGFVEESGFEGLKEFPEFLAANFFEFYDGEGFVEFVYGEDAPDKRDVFAQEDADEGVFEVDVVAPGECAAA